MSPTLDTRCDCLGVVVNDRVKQQIVKDGVAHTILTNSNFTGVGVNLIEDESVYTETEEQLFTEDGNIKRYLGGVQIDAFKEGQMATTTFPNGYGHGPRTHDESIALNTIDKPSVKQNLRIRKLTPAECLYLMGFDNNDYKAMRKIGMSDSAISHMAGDSIITTVLVSIFNNLITEELNKHEPIVRNYVSNLKS